MNSTPVQADSRTVKRYLPWVVATALFMEQLDSTIINTAVPSMAASLHVAPLSLKAVVTSYILSLAVCIPISGWMADRFGTRRVFSTAVAIFTISSVLCGLSLSVPMLVAARILQGMGAAMMMPAAAAAMGMKLISVRVLRRFGYRKVLIVNTLLIGVTISLFAGVVPSTPIIMIVFLGLTQGFFNSLQFSSMNSMAYADIKTADSSMASTIASSMQQMSMSFGLACGSLVTAWYLGDLPQSDKAAVTSALHHAFLTLGGLTMLSSRSFWTLRAEDGESVSKGSAQVAE